MVEGVSSLDLGYLMKKGQCSHVPCLSDLKQHLLNMWKYRSIPHGVMADSQDGNIQNSFLKVNGENFPAMRKAGGFVGHDALEGCLPNFETARFS